MSCLTFLGLCLRAGSLTMGEESCGTEARGGRARLLMSASDAAHGSLMRAKNLAEAAKSPHIVLPYTKEELGAVVGRGTPGMLAVTDAGLAAAFVKKLSEERPGEYDAVLVELQMKAERIELRRKEKKRHRKNKRKGKKRLPV